MAQKHPTNVIIDLSDIDVDDLVDYVAYTFTPTEVFDAEALSEWALENGFIRSKPV